MIIFSVTLFFVWIFFYAHLTGHENPHTSDAQLLTKTGQNFTIYCLFFFLVIWTVYGIGDYLTRNIEKYSSIEPTKAEEVSIK